MKRKLTAIFLCVALVAVAVVGGTLAYFTDQDQVENVFAIGDLSIDLWEFAGVGEFDDKKTDDYYKFQNGGTYREIMPGDAMVKAPVIENTGDQAAYVRVSVVMNNVGKINHAIDGVYETAGYTAEQIQAKYDEVFDGWGMKYTKRNLNGNNDRRLWMKERTDDTAVLFGGQIDMYCNQDTYGMFDVKNTFKADSETDEKGFDYACDGYYRAGTNKDERIYVFYLKLEKGESYQLFNGLNAPADFSNAAKIASDYGYEGNVMNQLSMFDDLKIGIYADAIQVAGFENDAMAAFNALEAEHPLGWWNKTAA